MKENHFLDDGAYSAVQIIIETVRRRLAGEGDISIELLKQLKEPKDASEFRLKITVNPKSYASTPRHLISLSLSSSFSHFPFAAKICLRRLLV